MGKDVKRKEQIPERILLLSYSLLCVKMRLTLRERRELMKTVLVTGGARGIGKAICRKFAAEGYRVLVNYNASEDAAKNLKEELGENCRIYRADISDFNSVSEMAAEIFKEFNKIDVLVNNAGIAKQKLFCDIMPDEWRKIFAVNVDGAYNCCKCFLPSMISEKSGSIINISSIWGQVGASMEVHYSATKAALIGFTKALAKEVAPSNITVNCVAPGIIETDMMFDLDKEEREALIEETPLGRFGSGEDVARSVFFLAEDTFTTGQVLSPNGGFVV